MTTDETPKIHVDSDWKDQARAEKERLAEVEKKSATEPGHPPLPEPDFRALMGTVASQAIMGLGAVADPATGRAVVDLEGSRFGIALLEVLKEKTQGNLAEEQSKELDQLISELQNRFVQIAHLVANQGASPGDAPPGQPDPGAGGPAGGVVAP